MKRFFKSFVLGLLPLIALALGFQLGATYQYHDLENQYEGLQELFTVTGSGQVIHGDPEKEVSLSILWNVWRLLQRHYVHPEELKADKMVFGAVSGLVGAVGDPYTVFLTPKDTQVFEDAMSGTLEGIGAQLDLQENAVVIVVPLKGSPAERAGLLPKDIITHVNGQELEGLPLEQVVSLIRGPKGTSVTLTIEREGKTEPLTIAVTRENIHIPSVESSVQKTATGSVGILIINQFGDDTVLEVKKAIGELPTGLRGLVLDLRFNGGGYLDGSVELVSMFLKVGKVVTVERRDTPVQEYTVTGQVLLPDLPLVVLINKGTASASEITAGALKDNGRATIVGTQSFGKGTVQEIIALPGGSSLRVTTARWLTPSGHDLSKKGITPDVIIDRTPEEFKAGYDPQLQRAMEVVTEGIGN